MKRYLAKIYEISRREEGQSILESLLCSIIVIVLLFGLLQVFHLCVATLLTDYSAFRTARSYIVGFDDYLLWRSARVAAIGASGKLVSPDSESFSSPSAQFASEELMIPEYIAGTRWLEYEYWFGENEYDPLYWDSDANPPETYLGVSNAEGSLGTVQTDVTFTDYPFPFFDLIDKNRLFFDNVEKSIDVTGTSILANHSQDYLGDVEWDDGAGAGTIITWE